MTFGEDKNTLTMSMLQHHRKSPANKMVLLFTLLFALTGCKTRYLEVEQPVVVEHTTTHHHTDIVRDTIMQRDSVYHYIQGDTTIIERWHTIKEVTKVAVTDTLHDTIPKVVKVTEVKEVERQLTKWERAKQDIGGMAIGVALVAMLAVIVWGMRKARKIGEKGFN